MINIFHNKLSILAIFLIGTVLFGGAIWLWIDLSSENKDNQNFAKTVQDEAGTNPVVSAPSVDEGLRSEIVFTDDFASADTLDESLTSAKINQEDNTVILSNVTVREHSIEEYLKQKTWGNEVWNMACADEYCLMVIKRDDHPNQVLRFDGESFTEVTAKVPNLSPVTEQGYLLRGGSGIIYATEKTVFNYDGSVFHDISPVLSNGDGGITAIGWNGNTIVVATGGQYSGPASTIYLLSSSGQLIRKDEVFTNYGRPQITSIVWGKDSWLLGAYDDWGTYFIVAEYFTDGSWNEVT
ncbi:MAG: hypothetical protein Q8Q20_04085, partial [bacterium]|nr:hypothetical protein [bacterium]